MTSLSTVAGGKMEAPNRTGGLAGDEKRKERAARKLEQQETEAAAGVDDVRPCFG